MLFIGPTVDTNPRYPARPINVVGDSVHGASLLTKQPSLFTKSRFCSCIFPLVSYQFVFPSRPIPLDVPIYTFRHA
jgi:hypothetical protein